MAASLTPTTLDNNTRTAWVHVAFDNSYPAGGYAFSVAGLGLVYTAVAADTIAGRHVRYDPTNQTLRVYIDASAAPDSEVGTGVDLSADSVDLVVHGRGA